MKKIIFINSRLTNGGSERVMTILANYFSKKNNYEVHMVLLRDSKKITYKVEEKIKLHQFCYKNNNKISKLIERYKKLKQLLKVEKPDIVVSFMIDINIFTLFVGRNIRNKIIVSERADPQSKRRNKIHQFLEKKLYPKCKKVVLQTNDVKKYYDNIGVKNTSVIPNPIDSNLPKPYTGEREKTIVAIGRLTEQKNFELLLNAFKLIHSKYEDYKLEIYGEGPLESQLKKQAKKLGVENNVYFMGFVENIHEKILKASMYVSSSNYEGISNAMIESLALGIPTICTDCPVGGAKMMIKNNKNGILIPMNSVDELYNAIEKIINNPDFAKKISNESIEIVNEYSIDEIAKKWEQLF